MPTYETQADRDNEAAFAKLMLAQSWTLTKLPDFYPYDFFAKHAQGQCFIEYKRRSHAFGTYPTVYIPAHKWVQCRAWTRDLGVPGRFYVQWNDIIKSCDILTDVFKVSLAGRYDRQQRDSRQPMVEIPAESFR